MPKFQWNLDISQQMSTIYVNYSQLMDGAFEYNYVLTDSLPTGSAHFVKGVLNSPTVIVDSSYFFL